MRRSLVMGALAALVGGIGFGVGLAWPATTTQTCPTPTAGNLPCVISGSKANSTANLGTGTPAVVGSLPLSAGKWSVVAKTAITAVPGGTTECRLYLAGTQIDIMDIGSPGSDVTFIIHGTQAFSAAGTAELRCYTNPLNTSAAAYGIKIIATRVGTLKAVALN